MASTTTYRRGQVIVVNVPFTGQTRSKPRPAVIVSAATFHRTLPNVIICPISSQPRYYAAPGLRDHPLKHWSKIGLRYPRTVRLSNLMAVDKTLIKGPLATMPTEDLERIESGLRFALGL